MRSFVDIPTDPALPGVRIGTDSDVVEPPLFISPSRFHKEATYSAVTRAPMALYVAINTLDDIPRLGYGYKEPGTQPFIERWANEWKAVCEAHDFRTG